MAVYPRSALGPIVSMLVAVKTEDGRVFWLGGKSKDCEFTFCRDPRRDYASWMPRDDELFGPSFDPYVEMRATITDYTGEWREGAPDVQLALNAGTPELPEPSPPLLPPGG